MSLISINSESFPILRSRGSLRFNESPFAVADNFVFEEIVQFNFRHGRFRHPDQFQEEVHCPLVYSEWRLLDIRRFAAARPRNEYHQFSRENNVDQHIASVQGSDFRMGSANVFQTLEL